MASPIATSRGRRGPGDNKMVPFPMQQLFILGMFSPWRTSNRGARLSHELLNPQIGAKELHFQIQRQLILY